MTSLSLTKSDFRKELSWQWLGHRDSTLWSTEDLDEIDSMIRAGERQFYHPLPVAGDRKGHIWSFLRVIETLKTVSGRDTIALPPDFSGFSGPITFKSSDNAWLPINVTGEYRIRQVKQQEYSTVNTFPQMAAVIPVRAQMGEDQHHLLKLYPTPNAAYTLSFEYIRRPPGMDDDNPYPICGQEHAETLLASCLAVAEQRLSEEEGKHTRNFEKRLAASVGFDRQAHAPDHMGLNNDHSDGYLLNEQDYRRFAGDIVDTSDIEP